MTIINHTHSFVFVHVPKNAGTSVSLYLSRLSSYRDQEIGATKLGEACINEFEKRFRLGKHSTYREIARAIGSDELASYTTIAVVRNPIDRVRSMYWFLRHWDVWRTAGWPWNEQYADEFDRYDNINDFVASTLLTTVGPDCLFMPQITWLADKASDTLLVNHVLRLESLEEDIARLTTDLDLPRDALGEFDLHTNVSDKDKAVSLNRASVARIRELYHRDFALLGYDAS